MIVNMAPGATQEQIDHVIDRIKECGFLPHLIQGAERTVIGVVGKNRGRRAEVEALRVAPGVDEILIISQPFTLVSLELQPQRTVVDVKGVKIGGPGTGGDGGALFGGVARTVDGDRARCQSRGSPYSSRRRLQAPNFALRFSGPGPRRAQDPGGSEKRNRPSHRDRSDGRRRPRRGRGIRGHDAGRRAQHAELSAAAQTRHRASPDPAQARSFGYDQGMAAGGRVPALTAAIPTWFCASGESRRLTRKLRNTLDLAGVALAKELCHLPVVVDPSHATGRRSLVPAAARGRRHRRRRHHCRSASVPGASAIRRAAIARFGGIRGHDAGASTRDSNGGCGAIRHL